MLAILGPGLVAATAGDDAGGVATYCQVGAKYGYDLLWVLLLITVSLAVVQEMCARLGAATGRGLLDLIRERFGIGWALLAVGVIVLANGGVTITEFVGIGAALELLGVSKYLAVPVAAIGLWYLVIAGSYCRVEKLFLVLTLVFFAYPVAAILAHPGLGGRRARHVRPHAARRSGVSDPVGRPDRHDDHAVHAAVPAERHRRKGGRARRLRPRARRRLRGRGIRQSDRGVHHHRHRGDLARGRHHGHPDRCRRRPGACNLSPATRRWRCSPSACLAQA